MTDPLLRYRALARPRVIGLMSGTSADAIDAAMVELGEEPRLLGFTSTPLPGEVRAQLHEVFEDRASPQALARLHWLLGHLFARAALTLGPADLVASHGQTVVHLPAPAMFCGEPVRATLQIGEPAVIAQETGCLTVADFRPADLACGGEGAPLVCFADSKLFHSPAVDRLVLNLGGMANLTWIPASGEVEACDTGPGNALIDALAERATGQPLDRDGALAARGRVLPELLEELMSHPFMLREGPKSTGREEFGRPLALRLWGRAPAQDLIRTAAAFTAASVALHVRRYQRGALEVIAAGGGVANPVLMGELEARLPAQVRLRRCEELGWPSQAREAVGFAWMGHETAHGRPSSLPSATGARRPAVLGRLCFP